VSKPVWPRHYNEAGSLVREESINIGGEEKAEETVISMKRKYSKYVKIIGFSW